MKISVFFYASSLESKAKNARRPMGGSIGNLRANSASSAIFANEQESRKEDFVCMLLETSEASRALYYMNVRFSLFCIHNIIYNRLAEIIEESRFFIIT